jgi:hypothetical protein
VYCYHRTAIIFIRLVISTLISVVLFLSNAALLSPAEIIKLTRRLEIGIREGIFVSAREKSH